MSINRVTISGNLTRDPELRSTQSGMNILNFGMAVNDRRKNQQTGEWEDYANFVDCVVFGTRCDFLSKTLHKGMKVMVDGKLRYSSWERDGQRRSKLEVVAEDIDLPPKGSGQQTAQAAPARQTNYPTSQQQTQRPSYATPRYPQPVAAAPRPQAPRPTPQQTQEQMQFGQMPVTTPPTMDVYDEDIPF